jgi:dihydroxyacetone kinase DhaKLM complex PTS-EIIA-like component DhaM
MTEILGKNPEISNAACRIDSAIHKAAETEPALARIQAGNAACKAEMAAELIADGFSEDQVRRLLHLNGGEALQEDLLNDMEE